jgi:TonB family protein
LPETHLRHRRRLAEVSPVCRPGTERRQSAILPEPGAERPASAEPSAPQLVIRIEISSNGPLQAPVRRRLSTGALLLILGAVAVLLSWVGISVLRTEPTSAPAAIVGAPKPESQSPAAVPAPSKAAPVVESEVRKQPGASASPISKVVPDVPRSARGTIRGTIRVSVRVIVDKAGRVVAATADDPGPSRYFERLAIQASEKWTFAPTRSEAQRSMLVKFNFTRAGTTARANSLQ